MCTRYISVPAWLCCTNETIPSCLCYTPSQQPKRGCLSRLGATDTSKAMAKKPGNKMYTSCSQNSSTTAASHCTPGAEHQDAQVHADMLAEPFSESSSTCTMNTKRWRAAEVTMPQRRTRGTPCKPQPGCNFNPSASLIAASSTLRQGQTRPRPGNSRTGAKSPAYRACSHNPFQSPVNQQVHKCMQPNVIVPRPKCKAALLV